MNQQYKGETANFQTLQSQSSPTRIYPAGKLRIELQDQKNQSHNDSSNLKENIHTIQSEAKCHVPKDNIHQLVDSDDQINNNNNNNNSGSIKTESQNKEDELSVMERFKYLFSQREFEVDELFQSIVQKSLGIFDKTSSFRLFSFKFYHSMVMRLLLIVATIVEIVGYLITDYSYRKSGEDMYSIPINEFSDFLQLICNSFFSLEILLGIIAFGLFQGQNTFLRSIWNIILILILIAGWLGRFFITTKIINIFKYLRILTFFRLFPELTKKVNAFFSSFQHLGKTFFPLICVILFYAVVGMSFFQGHVESRCRLTEHPEANKEVWEVDESNELTCGYLECPTGTYCGNPADYDLPFEISESNHEALYFGFNLFNSIEWSLFAVYNFLMVTGWIQTTYMYWRAQNKIASAIYFVSLVLFLSQVISNIILATLYEGFIDETSIKNQQSQAKRKVNKQNSINEKDSHSQFHMNGKSLQRKNLLINIESEENAQDKSQHLKQNGIQDKNSVSINHQNSNQEKSDKNQSHQENGNNQNVHHLNHDQHHHHHHHNHQNHENMKSESCYDQKSSQSGSHKNQIQRSQSNKNLPNSFKEAMATSPIIKTIFLLNLFLQIIVLCLDNHWVSKKEYIQLNEIDFATIIVLFVEIIFMITFIGYKRYFTDIINLIDVFVLIAHITSYIYEGIHDYDIFNPTYQFFILVRCTKVLRFFKIFFHYELFQNMTVILKTYSQTLSSIPEYIIVFCILVVLFAQIGRELFAYSQPHDDHHVLRVNFNTLQDSLVAVILIFYNEEWHVSMYNHMRFVGYQSSIYYLVCMLIGWVLFVRLFIAIFISQFMKWLRINEKEYNLKKDELDTIDMIFKRCWRSICDVFNKKNQIHKVNVIAPQQIDKQKSQKFEVPQENQQEQIPQIICLENEIFSANNGNINKQNSNVGQNKVLEDQLKSKEEVGSESDGSEDNDNFQQEEIIQQEKSDFKTFGERGFIKKPTIIGIRKSVLRPNLKVITSNNSSNVQLVELQKQKSSRQDQSLSSRPMIDATFNDGGLGAQYTDRVIPSNNKIVLKSNEQILQNDYIEPKMEGKSSITSLHQILNGESQNNNFLNPNSSRREQKQRSLKLMNEADEDDDYDQIQRKQQEDQNQLQSLNLRSSEIQTSSSIFRNKSYNYMASPQMSLAQIASGIYNNSNQQKNYQPSFNTLVKKSNLNEIQENSFEMTKKKSLNSQNTHKQHALEYKQKESFKSNRSSSSKQEQTEQGRDASLFIFSIDNPFRQLCTKISESIYFDTFMVLSIIFYAAILVWDSPFLDPKSSQKTFIKYSYMALAGVFCLELFIHLIQYGIIINGPNSYLRRNILQIIDFITTLATLFYIFDFSPKSNFVFKCIAIFRIIFLLQFLSKYNKDISFAGRLMAYCSTRMIKLILFAVIYLLMNGIVITKLLKDSSWKCTTLYHASSHDVVSKTNCMDVGGDWIESAYNFNSIVSSLQVLFMVQASEGWLQIMLDTFDSNSADMQLYYRQHSFWSLFYTQYFFIANICILNMFVGLIVESLLELVELEHGTQQLTKQQKEWYFIKKSINKLIPIRLEIEPQNPIRRIIFKHLITQNSLKIVFYSFAVLNGVSFLFFKNRIEEYHLHILTVLGIEIVCRMMSLGIKRYLAETLWNIFDVGVLVIGCINVDYQLNETITIFSNYYRIFDGIAKGIQMIRLIRVFNHFLVFRKLLNSLNYALSSILGIALILIVFLYTAVLLSLNLFPYLKFQSTINQYDLNFQHFFQALFSFIRIVTLEMWYLIPFEASQKMAPNFVCRDDMYDYNDFIKYGYQSCGSVISYLFFYIFFLIFTLIILNLFVATIIEAYKEAFSADESAINHYQLDDILKLWTKYDPQGKGYISYKEFWQFSSQIAIVYGVNSEELLDIENKNKFLKSLDIPIYEDPVDKIFCYKFHDVVVKLSKISVQIKYGVTNLEPKNMKLREDLDSQIKATQLKFESQIKSTEFASGDMILLIVLSRKAKIWKRQYIMKEKGGNNIFHFQALIKKLQSEKQNFVEVIRNQIAKEEEEERLKQNQKQ